MFSTYPRLKTTSVENKEIVGGGDVCGRGGTVSVFGWEIPTTANFLPRLPRFDSVTDNMQSLMDKVAIASVFC
jgi:hypothetical protein